MLAGVLFSCVAQAALGTPDAEALVLPLLVLFFVVRAFSPIWVVLAVGVSLAHRAGHGACCERGRARLRRGQGGEDSACAALAAPLEQP